MSGPPTTPALRPDLALIAAQVPAGARVLDIGSGDGTLMAALRDTKRTDVRGLEIDPANVAAAMEQGLAVVQGDADRDLADYPDDALDIAILSQTLQTSHRPDRIVGELLRIAPRAFVSFPNFAHWRIRLALLWGGRMPVTRLLPVAWYETPNIHHVTVSDFRDLVREKGIGVEGAWYLSGDKPTSDAAATWRAEHAIFLISR